MKSIGIECKLYFILVLLFESASTDDLYLYYFKKIIFMDVWIL